MAALQQVTIPATAMELGLYQKIWSTLNTQAHFKTEAGTYISVTAGPGTEVTHTECYNPLRMCAEG